MKLVGMAVAAASASASAFLRIPRSQSAQHFVGGNRATPFGFAFSSIGGGGGDSESSKFPRPKTVPWQEDLSNTIHLIGNIGDPVQMTFTKEGKPVACTKLGVRPNAKSDAVTWYQLNFLEELAGTVAEHLKTRDRVYVSGCLDFEKVAGGDDDPRTLYQVWVNRLNFVDSPTTSMYASFQDQDFKVNSIDSLQGKDSKVNSSVSLQSKVSEGNSSASLQTKVSEANSSASLQSQKSEDQEMKFSFSGKNTTANTASREALWRAYFDNPTNWWDNRNNKKSPKAPDFKHKDTGEGLWINGFNNPSWVKSKLDLLD